MIEFSEEELTLLVKILGKEERFFREIGAGEKMFKISVLKERLEKKMR